MATGIDRKRYCAHRLAYQRQWRKDFFEKNGFWHYNLFERNRVSRRPANFTQADVARVLRAAKQAGVTVEIKIGDMVVTVSPGEKPVDDQPLVRL
jgi:hypothetical protein